MADLPEEDYPSVWTDSTRRLLWIVVAVVVIALAGAVAAVKSAHARQDAGGEATLEAFLDAALAGDPRWAEHAAPEVVDGVTWGSPFRGTEAAARSLDLEMDYTITDADVAPRADLRSAHYLRARVEITYDFTLGGTEHSMTVPQIVWVTRPFFYDDGEGARDWRGAGEGPTRVGPWKVTRYEPDARDPDPVETTLGSGGARLAGNTACRSPHAVLHELATSVRESGEFNPECAVGDDPEVIGEEAALAALAGQFPFIPLPESGVSLEEGYGPVQEVARIGAFDLSGFDGSALVQYRAVTGEEEYILTVVLVVPGLAPGYALIDVAREG